MSRSPAEEFAALREQVEALQASVSERLESEDTTRTQAFDKLYGELKDYKDEFVLKAEKPLLLDLLLLHDSCLWFQQTVLKQEMSPEVISESFQFLVDELLEVLYRRGVVPTPRIESFDRTVQKAVKVVPAERAEDDNKVAQVVKRGFTHHDKSLRPEEVVVFKWKPGS